MLRHDEKREADTGNVIEKNVTSYWKIVVGTGVMLAVVALASADPAEGKNDKPKP